MSAEEKRQAREFFVATVKGKRCIVCHADERTARAKGTRLQAHHCISQQHLRKRNLHDRLWDPANGVAVCEYPCHTWHTTRHRPIPRYALPREALEFAFSLGLGYLLDRQYPAH
jgi:hypothetical protein